MISQDILDYLNGLIVRCPYCKQELRINNFPKEQVRIHRNDAYLRVFCAVCHNNWKEVIGLSKILRVKNEQ